jgi:hypothetical protein
MNDDPERLIADAVDDAEEVRDPLDGLVERAAADPGAPLVPEVLQRLTALKQEHPDEFEALRAQLKKARCRVTVLDKAIAELSGAAPGREPSQVEVLLKLAQKAELFHAPDRTAFADIDISGHRETWAIRSKGFKRWLSHSYFMETEGAPSSEGLNSALGVIEAKAHFDAPERPVHIRVAGLDGRLYLDLCDETWRAVEVDSTGWRVIDNPPVRFRRAAGMLPLPIPVSGGSVDALRQFLNVASNADFVLAIACVLASLRNRGPYPVLALSGEQGSAKSTLTAILRAVVDPNTAPLRALPREDRDLFIAASNSHVLAFDNVSGLPYWISDTLCRLATGGGFAVRQLYTDQDEVLFDATRPVILNGIEDIVTRPDLADRALFLMLEPIPEERRRPEAELWEAFETERPRILGALLDAVVEGLKRLPETRLERLPRMADFALWATACEPALWPAGTFWSAYSGNRDEAVESVISADPVADGVRTMMATQTEWAGTSKTLLGVLVEVVGERAAKSKAWPDSPRALSGKLRRAATFLRKAGIEISFGDRKGRAGARIITIVTTGAATDRSSAVAESTGFRPSAPSASSAALVPNCLALTFEGSSVSLPSASSASISASSAEKPPRGLGSDEGADGADDADANSPTQSAPGTSGTSNGAAGRGEGGRSHADNASLLSVGKPSSDPAAPPGRPTDAAPDGRAQAPRRRSSIEAFILTAAAEHPDWSAAELGKAFGRAPSVVKRILEATKQADPPT